MIETATALELGYRPKTVMRSTAQILENPINVAGLEQ
jgi:hypothetical protein